MEQEKIKSVEDFLNQDDPVVYHFYRKRNADDEGPKCLKKACMKSRQTGFPDGIYVCWRDEEVILNALCCSLGKPSEFKKCKIHLNNSGITSKDIMPDFNGSDDDLYSSYFVVLKDLIVNEDDIEDATSGPSDLTGIELWDLTGYNVKNKPSEYDSMLQLKWNEAEPGVYRRISWKSFDE